MATLFWFRADLGESNLEDLGRRDLLHAGCAAYFDGWARCTLV